MNPIMKLLGRAIRLGSALPVAAAGHAIGRADR